MKTTSMRMIGLGLALAGLAGCTMIPAYHRPPAPVPGTYAASGAIAGGASVADLAWRDFYREPHLQEVIELALANNRDLRVAVLNVESARAQYRIERADLLPTLSASAGGTVARTPMDLTPPGESLVSHSYSVGGAVASYEVDLFGRVRSLSRSALESWFATDAARHAVEISLIAEVANSWLTLQSDQQLLDLANETLHNQQASHRIVKAAFVAGTSTALDLSEADTQLHAAETSVAQYRRAVKQDTNALILLAGAPIPPQCLEPVQQAALAPDDRLAPGLPSDLLTRRPDIVEAEHRLKAANANIGAARAAFFPRIELTASGGTASASLKDLFTAGSGAWSFAPSISVPVFDYGRNKASLDVAKLSTQIEVANYEKAIQSAFRDVSDALDARETWVAQQRAQSHLVDASDRSWRLASERYQRGVDGYLGVLVNQRSLFAAQQQLIKVRLAREQNTVSLYRALGGGWKMTG